MLVWLSFGQRRVLKLLLKLLLMHRNCLILMLSLPTWLLIKFDKWSVYPAEFIHLPMPCLCILRLHKIKMRLLDGVFLWPFGYALHRIKFIKLPSWVISIGSRVFALRRRWKLYCLHRSKCAGLQKLQSRVCCWRQYRALQFLRERLLIMRECYFLQFMLARIFLGNCLNRGKTLDEVLLIMPNWPNTVFI